MLSVVYAIPHHHHDDVFCMAMEQCKEDGNINDEHTHHHDNNQTPDQCCIVKTHYIIPKVCNQVKCNAALCGNSACNHISQLLYIGYDSLKLNLELSEIKPEYGEYVLCYYSVNASRIYGLRAPPFVS